MMKKNYWLPLLSGIVLCIVYIYAFDSKLDLNGDNANYLRLAHSLAEGDGYTSLTVNGRMPASQYPPAYSAFLAFFMLLGIDNLIFFKVLNGLLLAASLFLIYIAASRLGGNRALAFASTLLVAFCPEVQHFANIVMSEMLFLFCTALCFFACYRQTQAERPFWRSPWFYVVILATTAAYYTRTVGMALVLGVLVFYLFRKEWWQAASTLGGIVLLNIPWSVRNAVHGIESRYFGTIMTVNPWRPEEGQVASVGDFVEKMVHNFDETVIKGFKDLLFPFLQIDYAAPSSFWAVVGGLLVLACVVLTVGAYAAGQIISNKKTHTITVGTPVVLDLTIEGEEVLYPGETIALTIVPDLQGQTGYNLHIVELGGTSTAVDGYSNKGDTPTWMFSSQPDSGFYGISSYGTIAPIIGYENLTDGPVTVYVKLNEALGDASDYWGTTLTVTFQLLPQVQRG